MRMSCHCCYAFCLFVSVIFCFFFFFFKQKTAYEMRISDWSSDVCSSDLTFPDAAAGGGDNAARPVGRLVRPVGAADRSGQTLQFSEIFQIGRASCRERVCQYV